MCAFWIHIVCRGIRYDEHILFTSDCMPNWMFPRKVLLLQMHIIESKFDENDNFLIYTTVFLHEWSESLNLQITGKFRYRLQVVARRK